MYLKYRKKNGFTLVEIIVAIALIGIVITGLMAGMQFAVKTLFASGDYMQENYVIQGQLEDFIGSGSAVGATSQSLNITWQNATAVPAFSVSGLRLDKASDSLHLHETIKAFASNTITPAQ